MDKQSIFRRESLDRVENRTQFRKENYYERNQTEHYKRII